MLQNPSQQFFVGHTASGNTQAGLHNILVAAGQTNPINLQKSKHHIHSDAARFLVPCGDYGLAQPKSVVLETFQHHGR